jgi:AcrR family transcriptional regulator
MPFIRRATVYFVVYNVDMAATTAQKIAGMARRLLDKEGAESVTMRRVATAVGFTPMALYRHYPNRNGLLNALADAGFVELTAKLARLRLAGSADRQLLKVLDVFLDHAFDNPRLFELMFLTKREGARQYPDDFTTRRSPTANVLADVIARAMEMGYLRKDDVWEIVFETGALMQGLIMLYLGGRMAMSPSEFRAFCHRSFGRYLNGIRA